MTYIDELLWNDLNITHYSTTLIVPPSTSFLPFMTSPHGERSISNSNDYSHYENPAKGLDQSITLPSTLSSSSSNNKMCEDAQQGQLGAINVALS